MDKLKQLADELYNQQVLDGWENVSMETCLKRATDYYRMDKLVKKLTIPNVSQQRELLKAYFEWEQKQDINIDSYQKSYLIDEYLDSL